VLGLSHCPYYVFCSLSSLTICVSISCSVGILHYFLLCYIGGVSYLYRQFSIVHYIFTNIVDYFISSCRSTTNRKRAPRAPVVPVAVNIPPPTNGSRPLKQQSLFHFVTASRTIVQNTCSKSKSAHCTSTQSPHLTVTSTNVQQVGTSPDKQQAPLHDRGGTDGQVLVPPKPTTLCHTIPKRLDMRILTERWLSEHPYWYKNSFPTGWAAADVAGQTLRDLKAYVRSQLFHENGELQYPEETTVFKNRLAAGIICARIPFGIVRPVTRWKAGSKRAKGDPSSCSWQELQNDPIELKHRKAASIKDNQSVRGRIRQNNYNEEYRAAQREQKKNKDHATTITSLGGMTGGDIAKLVMNTEQPKMGLNTTVLDYAKNIGGVHGTRLCTRRR
jgi:hypothetical protein